MASIHTATLTSVVLRRLTSAESRMRNGSTKWPSTSTADATPQPPCMRRR